MRLQVLSRPKKLSLKLIREAGDFFAKYTLSPRINPKVTIILQFDDELFKKEKCVGDCRPVYDDEERLPRDFIIQIDSTLSVQKILKTFAHEMTHVKQYSSGLLKDYMKANKIRWDKWVYDYGDDPAFSDTDFEYYLAPWEIEANGYEMGLYKLFQATRKK